MKDLDRVQIANTLKVWIDGRCVAICEREYDAHRISDVWSEVSHDHTITVTRGHKTALASSPAEDTA